MTCQEQNFSTSNRRSLIKETCRYLWELFKHTSASLMNFSSFIGFFNRNQKTSFEKRGKKQEQIFYHSIGRKNKNSSNIQHNFLPPPFYAVNESLFLFDRLFRLHEKEKKMLFSNRKPFNVIKHTEKRNINSH